MSYDKVTRHLYTFAAEDFSSGDRAVVLKNPRTGSKGKCVGIEAMVTTTCAGATTKPIIKVGKTAGATDMGYLDLGTTAGGTSVIAKSYAAANTNGLVGLAPGAHVRTANDGDVHVTLVAATGGGAAGVADVTIEIEWDVS